MHFALRVVSFVLYKVLTVTHNLSVLELKNMLNNFSTSSKHSLILTDELLFF